VKAGIPITSYHAAEIDKHAIKVSQTRHPDIVHLGWGRYPRQRRRARANCDWGYRPVYFCHRQQLGLHQTALSTPDALEHVADLWLFVPQHPQ
jgi:hypothetical protein